MVKVQLLLESQRYADLLRALLMREGYNAVRGSAPDFTGDSPIVADREAVERFPTLLNYPDRVVLIVPNEENYLSVLWQHKMRFVVFETDSPDTVLLSLLSAGIGRGGGSGLKPMPPGLIGLSLN